MPDITRVASAETRAVSFFMISPFPVLAEREKPHEANSVRKHLRKCEMNIRRRGWRLALAFPAAPQGGEIVNICRVKESP